MVDIVNRSYIQLDSCLTAGGVQCTTAEIHGTFTGLLCSSPDAGPKSAMDALSDSFGTPLDGSLNLLLEKLFQETSKALRDEELRFKPLLPDDESSLGERAEALASWCLGFLYGCGLAASASLSKQSQEIMRDLTEISQLDPKVEGEEDEQAFVELVEFVRVAVQLIFAESLLAIERKNRNEK